jgi:multiple sugar transport system ATP-binding protein
VQTRAELVELHRRIDTTVVYVTHDQVEAMTMGARIAILDAGRLQQVAPPQEVYDRPANRFVAAFIGNPAMNLLEGDLRGEGDVLVLEAAGASFPLPPAAADGARAAGATRAVVGARSEHLRVDSGGALAATVSVIEELGHERLVICRTPTDETLIVRQAAHSPAPDAGTAVHLAVDRERLHWFDAATGERLA